MTKQRIFVLIRSYCNENLGSAIERALDLDTNFDVYRVIVVTNSDKDQGVTGRIVERYKDKGVELVELYNYSWSNALNEGIRHIALRHKSRPGDLLLNYSVECYIDTDHLDKMVSMFDKSILGVGTYFEGFTGESYQHIRNTGCVWDLQKVLALGCFSTETDAAGGMEDYELALRGETIGWQTGMANKDNPPKLLIRIGLNQKEKEQAELDSMMVIRRRIVI